MKRYSFITENRGSKLLAFSSFESLDVEYNYRVSNGTKRTKRLNVNKFIDVKGYKALGKILDNKKRMSAYNFIKLDDVDHLNEIPDNIKKEDVIKLNSDNDDKELTLF